jgi:hypothetical protein
VKTSNPAHVEVVPPVGNSSPDFSNHILVIILLAIKLFLLGLGKCFVARNYQT